MGSVWKLLSSPSTSRKKPLGFFWRMRMAFSVVSTMDGSIFGFLSASKCRSPGSNRAGERNGQIGHLWGINTVRLFFQPTVEVQRKNKKSHLPPPPTTPIFQHTGSDQPQCKCKIQQPYSSMWALSPEKAWWLNRYIAPTPPHITRKRWDTNIMIIKPTVHFLPPNDPVTSELVNTLESHQL